MGDVRPIKSGVEWVTSPPPPAPRKVDVVAEQLRARPNEWAVIARHSTPVMPWWGPLNSSEEFEVQWRKSDPTQAGLIFAPVDVYARYVGESRRDLEGAPAE